MKNVSRRVLINIIAWPLCFAAGSLLWLGWSDPVSPLLLLMGFGVLGAGVLLFFLSDRMAESGVRPTGAREGRLIMASIFRASDFLTSIFRRPRKALDLISRFIDIEGIDGLEKSKSDYVIHLVYSVC